MLQRIRREKPRTSPVNITATGAYIRSVQKPNGEIPWSATGKTDPWDHVESAMGLTVAGHLDAAEKAYAWSRDTQLADGSWWSEYFDGTALPGAHKDANMSAYIAVGVLHYYLASGDAVFLDAMWHTVKGAMTFICSLQADSGQIYWAKRADGSTSSRALLTGASSMYLSLRCAVTIARILNRPRPEWQRAMHRLGSAIRHRPHLFDQSKSRYAMDWYYPILSGAIEGDEARARLKESWQKFIVDGWGVRCVCDTPWVTMAETAELALTLTAIGEDDTARNVLAWIIPNQYRNGAFWTGVTVPERRIYTEEPTTWTGAAVLLAVDMLYSLTPAWRIFSANHSQTVVMAS